MRAVLVLSALLAATGAQALPRPEEPASRLVLPKEKNRLPSGAGEVSMMEIVGRQTPEQAVVEAVVPEATGQPMETALYDIDGDGKAEVIARLKGKGACDAKNVRCRVVVLMNGEKGWKKLIDRPAQKVEVGDLGFGAMRNVILDGREAYRWDGFAYRVDVASAGTALSFQDAPANFRAPLVAQFGPGAGRQAARNTAIQVKVAQAVLNDNGTKVVVARLEGPGACGIVLGCPWRILQVKDGTYTALSEGFGSAKMSVLPVTRGGYRDLIVGTPKGFSVYGWSGKRYVVAERIVEGNGR